MTQKGLCFKNNYENIGDCINQNGGLCIVITTALWGELLLAEGQINVDYF